MSQETQLNPSQFLTKDDAQLALIAVHVLFFNLTADAVPHRQNQAIEDVTQVKKSFRVPYDIGRLFSGHDEPDCPLFVLISKLQGVCNGCL